MKYIKHLIATSALLLTLVACSEKEEDDAADVVATPTAPVAKATLSTWSVSNGAWSFRLADGGSNLQGTNFSMTIRFSDNSEVRCPNANLAGSEANGTYDSGTCSLFPGPTDPDNMAEVVGTAVFQTGGIGTYENNGSTLELCKFNGSCSTYQ